MKIEYGLWNSSFSQCSKLRLENQEFITLELKETAPFATLYVYILLLSYYTL